MDDADVFRSIANVLRRDRRERFLMRAALVLCVCLALAIGGAAGFAIGVAS